MSSEGKTIVVAAAQLRGQAMAEAASALAAIEPAIRSAAARGAELVVLPECAYPGYAIGSVAAYRAAAVERADAVVARLSRLAAECRIHVVCGLVEDRGDGLANAAVLLDAAGRERGRHRKTFLWDRDTAWFEPGTTVSVVETALGRIGMVICAEARCPELVATAAAGGADLVAMPTCWIDTGTTPDEHTNPQVEFLIAARAREFGLAWVCANKAGAENGFRYCGRSRIVDSRGGLAAEAPATEAAVIVSRVSVGARRRMWIPPSRRERLLSAAAPVRPSSKTPDVTLAILTGAGLRRATADGPGEALFGPLRERGVKVLAANVQYEATAEQIRSAGRGLGIETVGFPERSDAYEVGPAVGFRGFRAGCVGGQALGSFASTRALALAGATTVFAFDCPRDWALLRTRAAENRIFVVALGEDFAGVIGPDGRVVASVEGEDAEPRVVTIAASEAADKHVAPGTDVFEQRRVGTFRF
jgi:predicted amidohydrolase